LILLGVLALAAWPPGAPRDPRPAIPSVAPAPETRDAADAGAAPEAAAAPVVPVATTGGLAGLFVQAGYALEDVRASREVPRLLIANLPDDLPDVAVPAERKRIFIKSMLPLILHVNELVLKDRARVAGLRARVEAETALAAEDEAWLAELARAYRLAAVDFAELLSRIDAVPPSLAIAQAAAESGWGTSRFVREGNALFGQRVYGGESGLVPRRRDAQERHKVRAFDDLVEAVKAYVHNLNSHPAYGEFRSWRMAKRDRGHDLRGLHLVWPLDRYSEQGADYVRSLETIIRANDLEAFDDARLAGAGPARAGWPGI
jgi:Bax protein